MGENLPGQWLIRQHRQIDEAVEQTLERDPGLHPLWEALALLRRHLWVEEELLFDPVAATGLAMPVYIMQYEHARMWPLMEELDAACAAGTANGPALRKPCRALCKLFQVHNPKEEDLIYAAVDRLAEDGAFGAKFAAARDAEVPQGWVCHGRRKEFAAPPGAPPWPPGGRVV